jgi:hypothetical protein
LPISSSAIINAQIAVASALTPFQPELSGPGPMSTGNDAKLRRGPF